MAHNPDTRRAIKHLTRDRWPKADIPAFDAVFAPGDPFDDNCPPGSHLAPGTRTHIETAYRRWLAYLSDHHSDDLERDPTDRITNVRVAGFIHHQEGEVRDTTIASVLDGLHCAARLMAPESDWAWLASVQKRVLARSMQLDRLANLQAPWATLELGIALMDTAKAQLATASLAPAEIKTLFPLRSLRKIVDPHWLWTIRFRDGLVLANLSLRPIRRRSIAALTVDRHVSRSGEALRLQLFEEDTKAKRSETFTDPPEIRSYVDYYLKVLRPNLVRFQLHEAFRVSQRGTGLTADAIYQLVRRHTGAAFGLPMGLHDFRRAAGTHLAIHAPKMIGILPGVLQHSGPDMSDRHYKLAGSAAA